GVSQDVRRLERCQVAPSRPLLGLRREPGRPLLKLPTDFCNGALAAPFQIGKAAVLFVEEELDAADWAIAVLGDDHLTDVLFIFLLRLLDVVVIFAIQEDDQVADLFDFSAIVTDNPVRQPRSRPWYA